MPADVQLLRVRRLLHVGQEARWALAGVGSAIALMIVAFVVPLLFGWDVNRGGGAPLTNTGWRPRVGPGTVPAVLLGLAAICWLPDLFDRLRWRQVFALAYTASLGWLVSLAAVDGSGGIGRVLALPDEYLPTARAVSDIGATLRGFVGHIPADASSSWPTHVAGHPPGALLFFVLLDRLGLGGGFTAGLTVVVIAATIPVAVLLTVRALGAELLARRAAPVLVFGPAAIWLAVSADAIFATVAAWALCALAHASTRVGWRSKSLALVAGLLFGCCAFLSYGLPLIGVLALAVVIIARTARPIGLVLLGVVAVFAAFSVAGFNLFEAYPVLRTRYYAGIASQRPAAYWVWGDLAALCFSAGPLLGASLAIAARHAYARRAGVSARVVTRLVGAAAAAIVLADLSFMSKAEVQRIWLPFVPWLLLGTALLPDRWRRLALGGQIAFAVLLQSLFTTRW